MKEAKAGPASAGPYPAITAIAFIVAVGASLWWTSRPGPPAPVPIVESPPPEPAVASAPAQLPDAVAAYLAFAEGPPPAQLPLDHSFTAEGIRRLAAAIEAEGNTMLWRDRAARLRTAAGELGGNPDSLRHADVARAAFTLAAEWLVELRSRDDSRPHSRDIGQGLRSAAAAIQPDKPLRTQQQAVDGFFDTAAAAMAPAEGGPRT